MRGLLSSVFFGAYVFFMKYVAPIAIGIVFLNELGILKWITVNNTENSLSIETELLPLSVEVPQIKNIRL